MRTTILLLCLATPALAGSRARELAYGRATGPNMQWFFLGPDGAKPNNSPYGGWERPHYHPRTKVYHDSDGTIVAYPVKVKPRRIEYVYPGR